jgi:PP-loop superfamily ATP-utilizing enzyme
MCDCIKMVNDALKPQNAELRVSFSLGGKDTRVLMDLQKLDTGKRGKIMTLASAFCPFCGKAYDEKEGEK